MAFASVDALKTMESIEVEDVSKAHNCEPNLNMPMGREKFAWLNRQTVLAFLAIAGQLNAYEMSLLIPANAVGYIDAELGPSPNSVWINVTWSLGAAILVSVSGRLSDIFGRRYFMLFGALVSFIGTIVGATGRSITQMIISGVLFGIGSGVQEMGYACIMEFIPNKHRVTAIGLYGTCGLPSLLSPLITYAFIAHSTVGWRGAYWFMCAWHACAGIFLILFYWPPVFATKHDENQVSRYKLLREIDWVGLLLFVAGCTLFLLGINFGGRRYPWNSAAVIAPIIVGVGLLVLLFVWIFNVPLKYPLLPPVLFRDWRGYNVLVVVGIVCGMLYYSMQVLWPRQSALLFVPPGDPIMRGVYANITAFGTWMAMLSIWTICARFGYEKWQIVFCISCQTLFVGCLSTVGVAEKGKVIALVLLMSTTINPPLFHLFNMVSLNLENQTDIGVAIGALSTFRLLGGAVATAIYSAIVANEFGETLPSRLERAIAGLHFDPANVAALTKAATLNTPAAYAKVPGVTAQVISASELAVKLAYTQAFRVVYLTALGFAALALVSALLCKNVDPAKKTLEKAVYLENERKLFVERVDAAGSQV